MPSLAASGLPPAGPVPGWHDSSPTESLGTGRFPEGRFLRGEDQAHTGTLVPNETEK